jgi:hypothetical protein
MSTRIPIMPHLAPIQFAVVGTTRPARSRATAADPIQRPSQRVHLALLDADLGGPVALASPRRPIAGRLLGVLGPIGLALFLAAGYACGLRLYTNVSPLEDRGICVLAGFLVFFLIAVWPTFDDDGPGGDHRPFAARRCAAISEASRARS